MLTAASFHFCLSVAQNISAKAAAALALRQDRRHSITVCESPSQPLGPQQGAQGVFQDAAAAAAPYLSFNPSSIMEMAMDAVTSFMDSGDLSTNPVSNIACSATSLVGLLANMHSPWCVLI